MSATSPFRTLESTDPDLVVGGVINATVHSTALRGRADCSFWTPGAEAGPVPLVILLHGVYGSHWAWIGRGAADRTAADLITSGELPPFALAMPSDGLIGLGSGYVRHPGADVPSWVLHEVPTLASHLVPGIEADAPVMLVGLSMGGFGALRLGAMAGTRVTAVAGLSSMTELDQLTLFGARTPVGPPEDTERSVLAAVRANQPSLPALRFDCGRDDLLIEANRELHRQLDGIGVEHDWRENAGGHEWSYWRRHLPAALEFVVRRHETSR
jgi:putative tributyrin esterase